MLKLLGFTPLQKWIEFYGVNNGAGVVFDSYYSNGWLWLSSGGVKISYLGNATNPFVSGAMSDPAGSEDASVEFQAPLYSWDFIEDRVAGNGSNRACSPARGKGPEGRFLVLVERGDCLFTPKVQNAALAGAAGVVIYDSASSEAFPGSSIVTPGAPIPSVLVRRSDGLGLLKEIRDKGEGQAGLTWRAANLMGTLSGPVVGDELKLGLVLTEAWDYMFLGTVTGRVPVQAAPQALSFSPGTDASGRRWARPEMGAHGRSRPVLK